MVNLTRIYTRTGDKGQTGLGDGRRVPKDHPRVEAIGEAELAAAIAADPANDPEFWQRAVLVYPAAKERVTVRLDRDVLTWFRSQGRGYQTRINAVLRAYMAAGHKHG